MKSLYKSLVTWFLCLFLVLSNFIVSFADVNSLMIGSASNALMTLELDDSDYSVEPLSSMGSVTNTIDSPVIPVQIFYMDLTSGIGGYLIEDAILNNGRYYFNKILPDDVYIYQIGFVMDNYLPSPGVYKFSFDYTSDFAYDYNRNIGLWYDNKPSNVANTSELVVIPTDTFSGDIYVSPVNVYVGKNDTASFGITISRDQSLTAVGGSFAIRFVESSGDYDYAWGEQYTSSDYDNGVSSSLSDLSSSVDTMTDEISGVTEAIQNLQGAMEPHYSNVLTQLHHITEQLHAFYDQVYNNIHLPELSMLTQIKEAIENIDLQIEVDISEVKTAINNMSTAVQNKLQSTTDKITGGFDNSGIAQENEKLEQSINQYDEVESGIFEDAEGFIGDFEYPSVDSLPLGIIKALAFVGSFLQGIFLCMGDFGIIITFSLTMIFVMVVVGYHRIRS